jgi:hypothetical protein
MWAAISVEGMDSWDALSRAYAYVYQRPLEYLFYAAVSAVLGFLGWLFVSAFATAVIYLSLWAASWGSGGERIAEIRAAAPDRLPPIAWTVPSETDEIEDADSTGSARRAGAALIAGWSALVYLLALGFAYSYFWTAFTAIYFLLRRDADATPLDEIQFDEPEETYGLPPLGTEAPDMPVAVDAPPADNATSSAASSASIPERGAAEEPVRPPDLPPATPLGGA